MQRWDRVVCIQSPHKGEPDKGKLCSAFLVNANERLFLVTAGHAAEETSQKSRLIYRDETGESQWVYIAFSEISSDHDWGHEPIIYCSFALAQGTSGGPAFMGDEPPDSATIVGMYVGVVRDASGAKLSKMVPSRFIHAAVSDHAGS